MDATDVSSADSRMEEALEKYLQQVIRERNLAAQRELIQQAAARLNLSVLDCAAALLYLSQPLLLPPQAKSSESKTESLPKPGYRSVRYRLDVGSQHHVSKEQIQAVLIEESGVDKKRIGRIDIRHNYTLVELPDGMPADIFQLLSEATIGERKLAIKRVKANRRRPRETKDGE
ncbi:MAG: DbpA RNA binding domain-containing protein [Methylococcaceae bacterium]|nr:DbpA RNA binding domain-containing protein [Methylococcaceae bacterium]